MSIVAVQDVLNNHLYSKYILAACLYFAVVPALSIVAGRPAFSLGENGQVSVSANLFSH